MFQLFNIIHFLMFSFIHRNVLQYILVYAFYFWCQIFKIILSYVIKYIVCLLFYMSDPLVLIVVDVFILLHALSYSSMLHVQSSSSVKIIIKSL